MRVAKSVMRTLVRKALFLKHKLEIGVFYSFLFSVCLQHVHSSEDAVVGAFVAISSPGDNIINIPKMAGSIERAWITNS